VGSGRYQTRAILVASRWAPEDHSALDSASLIRRRMQMTAVQAITAVLTNEESNLPSPADLAAAAFLARYSGRTFEAYRHDLRT
jgi:hypothetical protein